MSRTFQDEDFLLWEAYASSGDFGYSENAHIVFHCITDPSRRARYVERPGDQSDAERAVAALPEPELRALFAASVPTD